MYEPSFVYKGITINYHFVDNKTIPIDIEIEPTLLNNKVICIDVWGIYKEFERQRFILPHGEPINDEVYYYVIKNIRDPIELLE